MDKELIVVLTQSHDGKPLAVVRNLPGLDAEMTPTQMRALADLLRTAADECESRPMGKKDFRQMTKMYEMGSSSGVVLADSPRRSR